MSPFVKYFLCALLGLAVGVGGTAAVVATAIIPKFNQALDEDQKQIADRDQAAKALTDTMLTTTKIMSETAKMGCGDLSQQTLLYDSKALAGLNAAGSPPTPVYPTNRAVPYNGFPRWVIPGKVKPMILGESSFSSYSYYDPKKNTYDGPYLPNTPTLRQ